MKAISKNGVKLDVQPKNKWSLIDWYWCFEQCEIIKIMNLGINTEGFKFIRGTVEQVKQPPS